MHMYMYIWCECIYIYINIYLYICVQATAKQQRCRAEIMSNGDRLKERQEEASRRDGSNIKVSSTCKNSSHDTQRDKTLHNSRPLRSKGGRDLPLQGESQMSSRTNDRHKSWGRLAAPEGGRYWFARRSVNPEPATKIKTRTEQNSPAVYGCPTTIEERTKGCAQWGNCLKMSS